MRNVITPMFYGIRQLVTPAMDNCTENMNPETEGNEIKNIYEFLYIDSIHLIWEM